MISMSHRFGFDSFRFNMAVESRETPFGKVSQLYLNFELMSLVYGYFLVRC